LHVDFISDVYSISMKNEKNHESIAQPNVILIQTVL